MISIIIPSFNRVNYLRQLLDSILTQSYKDIEIIVVDDNSKDGTESLMIEYLTKFPIIKYFRNEKKQGCSYNRGFGLKKSKGDYIIFADDDDYYLDNLFFEKAIQIFETNENISFVSGNVCVKNEKKNELTETKLNILGYINQQEYINGFQYLYNKPTSLFSSLFSRKVLEKSGIENMEMVNDSSIYLRSLLYGTAFIMDDVIGVYRIHNHNITNFLDSNFILQNLQEKKKIQNIAQDYGLLYNSGTWMKEQFLLTVNYYFCSSKVNFKDFRRIMRWCYKGVDKDRIFTSLLVLKLYLKNKLRSL